jgi:hypothetical protein
MRGRMMNGQITRPLAYLRELSCVQSPTIFFSSYLANYRMLFFYGTGTSNAGTYPLPGITCVNCGTPGTLSEVVSSRYAHFFWIPLFPFSKRALTVCAYCKQALNENQWPAAYRPAAFAAKQLSRAPLTNYIGLLLLAIPVAFVLLGGVFTLFGGNSAKPKAAATTTEITSPAGTSEAANSVAGPTATTETDPALNEAKLADPHVGDLYVVYNAGSHLYTVMRVERVEADKLYFKVSLYTPQSPATVSPDSVANHLQGSEYPIAREGLGHMNENKTLTIVRP